MARNKIIKPDVMLKEDSIALQYAPEEVLQELVNDNLSLRIIPVDEDKDVKLEVINSAGVKKGMLSEYIEKIINPEDIMEVDGTSEDVPVETIPEVEENTLEEIIQENIPEKVEDVSEDTVDIEEVKEVEIESETIKEETKETTEFKTGDKITLSFLTHLYNTCVARKPITNVVGTYYIWNSDNYNGRIRICENLTFEKVIGWINVSEIR